MQSVVCTSIPSMFQQAVACCVREEGREAFVCFGIPLMRNLCRLGQDFVAPLCNTAAHMPDHLLKCLHEHLTLSPVECATAHAETQALDHLGNRTCNKGKEYIQKCDPPGPSCARCQAFASCGKGCRKYQLARHHTLPGDVPRFPAGGTGDEIICFSIWYQSGFNERRTTDEGCQVLKPALLGRYGRALEMPTARNFTSSVKVKLLIKGGCLALYTALEMDECFSG